MGRLRVREYQELLNNSQVRNRTFFLIKSFRQIVLRKTQESDDSLFRVTNFLRSPLGFVTL